MCPPQPIWFRKTPAWLIFSTVLAAGLNSTNYENLVKYLYICPDMRHFMIVTKKILAFRHRNQTSDNFIKPRSIFKTTLRVARLVEVVNAKKQLSISKSSVLSTGFQ